MLSITKSSQKNIRNIIHIEILLTVIAIFGALFYNFNYNYYFFIPAGIFALFYIPFAFNSNSNTNTKFGNSLAKLTRKFEIWSIGNETWLRWVPLVILYGALLTITLLMEMVSIFILFTAVSLLIWFLYYTASKNR